MQQPKEIKINLTHKSVAGLEWGATNSKPIIALHGWLDNAASFIPLAPYLHDFRLIAIDLPGHGLSDHLLPGTYFHMVDYVADVINIIDYFNLEQCAILGHSLGAGIGSMVAGVIPDRISALALIDGIGPLTINENKLPDMLHKAIAEYAHLPNKKLTHYANKQEAIQARLSASKMNVSSVECLVDRGLKAVQDGFIWSTDPKLLCTPLFMFSESQAIPFLNNISCNTCLLRPSPGWPFDEKMFTNRINSLQNVEVHRINGDHHIHMDQPEIVGPILQEFFTRILCQSH